MRGWMHLAECKERDPALWDGVPVNKSRYSPLDFSQAKLICDACPVRRSCLEDALEHGDIGVMRGGVHPALLEKMAREHRNTQQVAL